MRLALTALALLAAALVACGGEEAPDVSEQVVVGTAEVTFQYPVSDPAVYPECYFRDPCATRDGNQRQHTGVDLTSTAPEVRAVLDGTVVLVVKNGDDGQGGACDQEARPGSCLDHGMGNVIVLFHEEVGLYTLYAHMEDGSVPTKLSAGVSVDAGDLLGQIGATAFGKPTAVSPPHLHFEIKEMGVLDSPFDCAAPDWGYVDDDPASCGYRDPTEFLRFARSVAAATPTPTPSPTATPVTTMTPSPTPTATATPTATSTPAPTPTPIAAISPTQTPTPILGLHGSDLRIGPLPRTATVAIPCEGGTFSVLAHDVPIRLTDQPQKVRVSIRYIVSEGATEAAFVETMSLMVWSTDLIPTGEVGGTDILAAFPDAQGVEPGGNYRIPYLRFPLPQVALVADGIPHDIEWSFTLPTEVEYDSLNTQGWLWSRFSASPFTIVPSPTVTLMTVADGVRYFVSHSCVSRPADCDTCPLEQHHR